MIPKPICFILLKQLELRRAFSRARAKTGNRIAAKNGDNRDNYEKLDKGETQNFCAKPLWFGVVLN